MTAVPRGPASLAGSPGQTIRTSEVDPAADLDQSRVEQLGRSQPCRAAGRGVEGIVHRNDRRVVGDVEDVEVPRRPQLTRKLERLGQPYVELITATFVLRARLDERNRNSG